MLGWRDCCIQGKTVSSRRFAGHRDCGHSSTAMLAITRPEETRDAQAIGQLTHEAFRNASTRTRPSSSVRELRRVNARAVSLIAKVDRHVVSHVAVSAVQICAGASHWFWLSLISVSTAHQG